MNFGENLNCSERLFYQNCLSHRVAVVEYCHYQYLCQQILLIHHLVSIECFYLQNLDRAV